MSKLMELAVKHGGYLTLGEIAENMGWCRDVAEVAHKAGVQYGVQPVRYWTLIATRLVNQDKWSVTSRAFDLLDALQGFEDVKVRKNPVGYSATYKRWLGILSREDKTLSNTEVVYLGHRFSDILGGRGFGRANMSKGEVYDLYIAVERGAMCGGYLLTAEQVEKGKSWLQRRDVFKEVMKLYNETTAQRLKDTQDFRFVGYTQVDSWDHTTAYKPVYQAIDSQGARTNYWASPYQDQRGARIEIVTL